jgi:fluoride ion exporter CrcB/FEX
MNVNEIGALLIGIVIGWLLASTLRQNKIEWKHFSWLVTVIVGGSGLDYIFKTNLVGYFWIGIFIGFFANIIIRIFAKEYNLRKLFNITIILGPSNL